jgi:hypothetical protein
MDKQPLKLSVNPVKPQLIMNSGRGITPSPSPFGKIDVGAATTRIFLQDNNTK